MRLIRFYFSITEKKATELMSFEVHDVGVGFVKTDVGTSFWFFDASWPMFLSIPGGINVVKV